MAGIFGEGDAYLLSSRNAILSIKLLRALVALLACAVFCLMWFCML
jgi:hypothetical protein